MPTHELNCVPPNVNKYTIQGDALNLIKNKNYVLEKRSYNCQARVPGLTYKMVKHLRKKLKSQRETQKGTRADFLILYSDILVCPDMLVCLETPLCPENLLCPETHPRSGEPKNYNSMNKTNSSAGGPHKVH